MIHLTWASAIFLALSSLVTVAIAQTPVAIVEEIQSKSAGLEFMDYLTPGRIITLEANEKLIVGYFRSCWRETIVGGTVTIGAEQSTVQHGRVDRQKVPCTTGQSTTSRETTVSGAMVFRNVKQQSHNYTVYTVAPIFALSSGGTLLIERLDKKENPISITTVTSERGAFVDLYRENISLVAGGLYRAKHGGDEATFKIDLSANLGGGSIVGRLVHLRPLS